jgi:hypothetical protein
MSIDKRKAFALLGERGASRAIVEFSGGCDEGGADTITLYDSGGEQIASLHPYSCENPAESKLVELLCAPVDEQYGTFSGDFEVYGTVTWDVDGEKCVLGGTERSEWTETPAQEL